MDIRNRVLGDQPDSFLHKIAGIVPGYTGYVDRERRRDADKLLRTHLARRYNEQRDKLNRVQQTLARTRQMEHIAEVDRVVGILQRFIDRLSTATYGYAGLFAPIRVEAADLDQLYSFDMALAGGVDSLSAAIESVESAVGGDSAEVPAALSRLSNLVDELNRRLDQRADLLTSGTRLPDEEFRAMLDRIDRQLDQPDNREPMGTSAQAMDAGGSTGAGAGTSSGIPTTATGVGVGTQLGDGPGIGANPGGASGGENEGGIPTTRLERPENRASVPAISSMSEGNQGFADMPSDVVMGDSGTNKEPLGGTAGSGIETASSPSQAPGAPGHNVLDGASLDDGGLQSNASPGDRPNISGAPTGGPQS